MEQIQNKAKTKIGLLKKDIENFECIIKQSFFVNSYEISDKYIGGCILENEEEGIFIDNTILNSINENLKG